MSDGSNFLEDLDNFDLANPLERYMKNNHLSLQSDKSQTFCREKKSIQFNKQNSVLCSNNTNKNSKIHGLDHSKKNNHSVKVSNKPPKYNYIANFELAKQTKSLNNDAQFEHQTKPTEFLKKKLSPACSDNSIVYKNDSIEVSSCESDEDIRNESRDLKSLKNKIDQLRQQLFNEIRESKEFLMMNDEEESGNEVELSLDDNLESNSDGTYFSNIESINLSNRKFSSKPKKIEQKSFVNSSKKNAAVSSLDFRIDCLVEKSQNSLSEKNVSSDGLSSNSFASSLSSSCSTLINDTDIHKPEFVLYLENKNKPSYEPTTGKSLNPENDILYQWRLRRKLEETKKTNEIFEPVLQPLINNAEKTNKKNTNTTKSDVSSQINEENEEDKEKKTLMSIQTQTLNMVDTEIQTEPEIKTSEKKIIKRPNLEKIESKRDKSVDFEIPTKDCEENKKEKNTIKQKFTSSSPIKQTDNFVQLNKMSTDNPNKISPSTKKTEVKKSISLPDKSKASYISKPNSERPSVTSSFASTLSSICSSITNVTGRESPINLPTSPINQLTEETKTITKSENSLIKIEKNQINETKDINLSNEYMASFEENDKELFESDDILRILIKKSYFYQLKLKQIDELITK